MPLKYVFFDDVTGEFYAAEFSNNEFAKLWSKTETLPEITSKTMPVKTEQKPGFSFEFYGDSSNKVFYGKDCYESFQIKPVNRVLLASLADAESQGYKMSEKCSTPPKEPDPPKESPRKAAKAYNILEVLTYPEFWTDRKITIKGRIRLYSLPDRDGSGRRVGHAFQISDNSASIIVIAPETQGTNNLRNAIIGNDGAPVEGTFTFIVPKVLDASIGSTDKTIGKLLTFALIQ